MIALPDWVAEPDRGFFEWAIPVLEEFAGQCDLALEPWFKDVALWALHFQHPLGGVGQIVVGLHEREIRVSPSWWRDDFASETRHLSQGLKPIRAEASRASLSAALESAYDSLLKSSEQELEPHKMPEGTWHQYFTEESLHAWERSLPRGRR